MGYKLIISERAEQHIDKIIDYAISFLDSINKPHTICEIGKERIRRAGRKTASESMLQGQSQDYGFRDFSLDEGNMNDVYYSAGEYNQSMLSLLESNVKSDRTDLDLLFGCPD